MRPKAAIHWLLVLLTLPLWLTTLPAQEPGQEESRRIIARAEQQRDGAYRDIGNIERDLDSKLIERDNSVIPLVQKAAAIASQARALADRLGHSTSALKTAVYDAGAVSRWSDSDEGILESKRARCKAVRCRRTAYYDYSSYDPQNPSKPLPLSEDELQKTKDIISSCSEVDASKSYRQKLLSRLRGAIAKATAAAGTVSGMIATFDLQSRGLDPQAPLNEAETKLHAANSRLADMAVLAVQRLQRISKNLQRENLELWRVRLPELEPRALQLRRVLAVVRDRSDKLVARLSAKAEERPTLEKFALSFGVSAKDLADFRGARAAVLKQLSRAKDELDLYRNWFSRARGWVEEDQSQWKPEPAWAPCPSPGAGGDLETGRLTPETQDPDSDTDTPKTRLSSTGCPATQLQAGQVQVPSVEGFHYKMAITMLGGANSAILLTNTNSRKVPARTGW